MLVLTRKTSEELIIRDSETGVIITVKVVRTGPHTVKIGIEAPENWDVIRPETVDGDLSQWIKGLQTYRNSRQSNLGPPTTPNNTTNHNHNKEKELVATHGIQESIPNTKETTLSDFRRNRRR